jgi:hypothetical protein
MWEDLGVAAATVVIALASLDRRTAVEKVIDAVAFGLGAAVIWQLVRWAGRFVFAVPREMHSQTRVRQCAESDPYTPTEPAWRVRCTS